MFNGKLWMQAESSATVGLELFNCDTEDNCELVKDVASGSTDGAPEQLTVFNGKLYFVSRNQLWSCTAAEECAEVDVFPS